MARKSPAANSPQPANLSEQEIRNGLPRLKKRIDELSKIEVDKLDEEDGDNALDEQVNKINAVLMDVFGHNTIE